MLRKYYEHYEMLLAAAILRKPKAGHRSNLASLRFRVNAATERRKHTQVDFFVDYAALSNNRRVSDQLGTFGRRRIHVHVTGDKTQE